MIARRAAIALAVLVHAAVAPLAWAVDIESSMRQMVQAHDLRGTKVAICVMDMETGETLAALNADDQMIPASNMKLVTTASALDVLGPDFVFRTELSVLENGPSGQSPIPSLVVRGDGDPAFGDPILLEQHGLELDALLDGWANAVAATGHKRFAKLIIDDRVFDQEFSHPDWPHADLVKAYGAQVAGLNFYQNVIDVLPEPTKDGQPPRVHLFPQAPFLDTTNRARTGPTDFFTLDRKLGTNELIFGGSVKNRRTVPFQVTIHDPSLFFAQVFAHRLAAKGIKVETFGRPEAGDDLTHGRTIHIVQTTLPLVLARTNKDSQNMFAESLIKRMGRQMTGQPGSWENGAAAVRAALRQRLDARSASITVVDGSGMSRQNRVTARLLVELLRSLHHDPSRAEIFRDSLSVGGDDGTLQQRFEKLNGKVYGKSGYLNGVSSLSGYLYLPQSGRNGAAGEPRVIGFSLLFNGFKPPLYNKDMKNLQNKLVQLVDQAIADPVRLGG